MVFFPIWGSESRSMQSFLILTNLTQACFFFSLFSMIWKEKKKKKKPESDWSASLLVLSPRQCPHRHQHFVYSLSVMLCLFRLGTHRHTNTRTVLLEVEERRGGRGWREKELGGGGRCRWGDSSFLTWCTAKCWVHAEAKPTVSFKS